MVNKEHEKKKNMKKLYVLLTIVVVIALLGVGFWFWKERTATILGSKFPDEQIQWRR